MAASVGVEFAVPLGSQSLCEAARFRPGFFQSPDVGECGGAPAGQVADNVSPIRGCAQCFFKVAGKEADVALVAPEQLRRRRRQIECLGGEVLRLGDVGAEGEAERAGDHGPRVVLVELARIVEVRGGLIILAREHEGPCQCQLRTRIEWIELHRLVRVGKALPLPLDRAIGPGQHQMLDVAHLGKCTVCR